MASHSNKFFLDLTIRSGKIEEISQFLAKIGGQDPKDQNLVGLATKIEELIFTMADTVEEYNYRVEEKLSNIMEQQQDMLQQPAVGQPSDAAHDADEGGKQARILRSIYKKDVEYFVQNGPSLVQKLLQEGQTALLEMDQFHGKCLQTLEKKLMRVNLLSKVLQQVTQDASLSMSAERPQAQQQQQGLRVQQPQQQPQRQPRITQMLSPQQQQQQLQRERQQDRNADSQKALENLLFDLDESTALDGIQPQVPQPETVVDRLATAVQRVPPRLCLPALASPASASSSPETVVDRLATAVQRVPPRLCFPALASPASASSSRAYFGNARDADPRALEGCLVGGREVDPNTALTLNGLHRAGQIVNHQEGSTLEAMFAAQDNSQSGSSRLPHVHLRPMPRPLVNVTTSSTSSAKKRTNDELTDGNNRPKKKVAPGGERNVGGFYDASTGVRALAASENGEGASTLGPLFDNPVAVDTGTGELSQSTLRSPEGQATLAESLAGTPQREQQQASFQTVTSTRSSSVTTPAQT